MGRDVNASFLVNRATECANVVGVSVSITYLVRGLKGIVRRTTFVLIFG